MEYAKVPGTNLSASRIGLATWAIGRRRHSARSGKRFRVGPEFMAPPAGRLAQEQERLTA